MEAVYISTNQCSVSGNRTSEFVYGRRLQLDCGVDGIKYCTVSGATYSDPNTIITTKESELTSNLSTTLYGIVEPGFYGSLPDHTHDGSEGSGGYATYDYSIITSNTDIYISVSGSDTMGDGSMDSPYNTFEKAYDYLKDKRISMNASVYIRYLDGFHTLSGTLGTVSHIDRDKIYIYGSTVLTPSITSVQSSSGSSGAYSIIFNMSTVSGIEVGEYMLVTNNAAGGTNPTYACGVHEITNIDVPNNRITVTSKHRKGAPAGAVTASVKIFKTVLNSPTTTAIRAAFGGFMKIGYFALVGGSSGYGIECAHNSQVFCMSSVAISGFSYGVLCREGSMLEFSNCGASGAATNGVVAQEVSSLQCPNTVSSGNTGAGFIAAYSSSSIEGSSLVSTGNTGPGVQAGYNSIVLCNTSTSTGNGTYGWVAVYSAVTRRSGTCVGGNNTSGDTYTASAGYVLTT